MLPLANSELPRALGDTWDEHLWRGGYPALHASEAAPGPPDWFTGYVATYLERDVRQLLNVANLLTFQRFVMMCAARSGQLLNLNSLGNECGISQPTARQWLTVLQASHLVTLLPPYPRNFGKRLIKTPKLYFIDSGLLCHLLQIRSPDELALHPMRGAVFESWIVAETLKHRFNQALPAELCFWRDNHGLEVDLVFEQGARLPAVEVKSGATFMPESLDAARRWQALAGAEAAPPVLVYGGAESFECQGLPVVSWLDVGRSNG